MKKIFNFTVCLDPKGSCRGLIRLCRDRNLDFETKNTSRFGQTEIVQKKLEDLLKKVILSNQEVKIEHRLSGIMGISGSKKQLQDNSLRTCIVACALVVLE